MWPVTKEELEKQKKEAADAAKKAAEEAANKKIEELKTQTATEMEDLKKQLKDLTEQRNNPPAPATPATPVKLTAWDEDPEKAHAERNQPIAEMVMDTRAMLLKKDILENKKFYKLPKIKQEVDALLAKQNVAARCNPEVIENAYNIIIGNHHTELSTAQPGSAYYLETGTGGNNNHTPDAPKTGPGSLTDTQKAIARRMGVSEDKYAEQIANMVMVG